MFFLLTVFWCFILFTDIYIYICVLNEISGKCWCTWLLVAPQVSQKCFWLTNIRQKILFSICLHVLRLLLKCCSDIIERKGLQHHFYFLFSMNVVASFIGETLSNLGSGFRLKSLLLKWYGNVRNWTAKVIWQRFDWFCRLWLEYAWLRQLHTYWSLKLQEILRCDPLLTTLSLLAN